MGPKIHYYTIAGHVNPENKFSLEKQGPCTLNQCYGDAFRVLMPATVYKRKNNTKAKVTKSVNILARLKVKRKRKEKIIG